jgi:hypothetical protein
MALPEFRWPNLQTVLIKLMDRARIFLKRAGTVIFLVAIIVWGLAYFPRSAEIQSNLQFSISQAQAVYSGKQLEMELRRQVISVAPGASLNRYSPHWVGIGGYRPPSLPVSRHGKSWLPSWAPFTQLARTLKRRA